MSTYSIGFDIFAKDRASDEFDKLGRSVDGTKGKFDAMKAGVATAAAGAASAFAAFAVGGIDDAAALEQSIRRTDILFGESAGTIKAWADGAAENIGLTENAALTAAGQFGNLFSQLGFGADEAANMSTGIVDLTADLAAFNGLETADVVDAMSAAFRGEYDALQKVIPGINDARVKSEALAMTGKTTADALTEQEKAAAVLKIAHDDGAIAAGYFKDNQDALAVSSQTTKAKFSELQAELGEKLVPVMEVVVEKAGEILAWMEDNPGKTQAVAVAVGALAVGLTALSVASSVATIAQWSLTTAVLAFPGTWIVLAIAAVVGALVLAWKESETFRDIVGDAFAAVTNAAIAVYNYGVAPMARWVLGAFADIMDKFADMLQALSKVPGFEWASDAAGKIRGAADSARNLSQSIKEIPAYKRIDIEIISTEYKQFGSVKTGMRAFAAGGRPEPGELALVGEEGPELWVPDSAGTVIPADRTAAMLSRGGGSALGGGDLAREIAAELGPVFRTELRRNLTDQIVAGRAL